MLFLQNDSALRDGIVSGYYSEIYFPSKDVSHIAIADGFDSLNASNEIAPFKNILNDMYARDISRKVKNAKRQHTKNGRLIASHAPYGYCKDEEGTRLIIDPVESSNKSVCPSQHYSARHGKILHGRIVSHYRNQGK